MRFWRSWQAFIKHAATKKRQVALHFWDFSSSFQEVLIEFTNAANEEDFEREFFAMVLAKKKIDYLKKEIITYKTTNNVYEIPER